MTANDTTFDPYSRFAAFYDLEYEGYDADLDLYRQFAVQANGPILELGCGSGRVLAALQDLGLPLTGTDNSPAMLAIAGNHLSPDIELTLCNMESIGNCADLRNRPYWMAFSAINTFLHLPDLDAQMDTLRGLRDVVVPGGLLLLDLMTPDPHYLANLDGRVQLEFSTRLSSGDRLDKWVMRTHDLATQTILTTVFFDTTDHLSGTVTRVADQYTTRYIHRFELEHLLERAGWQLVSVYGSYDLEPYHSDAERMIALATWGGDARWEV